MTPLLIDSVEAVREAVAQARSADRFIGLVPTMGALHEGHASLLRAARRESGFVVATIFVNPTQFGPQEDFSRYPRSLDQDLAICEREETNVIFAPDVPTIYPPSFCTFVEVEGLQDGLCGASRPGHFRGVATVVLKLLHIVQPDFAYFGQKDAQQLRIIQQMVHDLNVPVRVRACPIIREPDGLALSSRNSYLDPDQRQRATVLHRSLEAARGLIQNGERNGEHVRRTVASMIESTPGAELDYAEVVDAVTLRPLARLQGDVLIAVAVKFGATRLIDNLTLHVASTR
jgi:pantoate--beta-alanine ligase